MRSEAGRGGRVERSFVRALAVTGAMVVAAWLAASALPSPALGAGVRQGSRRSNPRGHGGFSVVANRNERGGTAEVSGA